MAFFGEEDFLNEQEEGKGDEGNLRQDGKPVVVGGGLERFESHGENLRITNYDGRLKEDFFAQKETKRTKKKDLFLTTKNAKNTKGRKDFWE